MKWKFREGDIYKERVDEVFLHSDKPVLVHRAGVHPELFDKDGKSHLASRYFEIVYTCIHQNTRGTVKPKYTSISLTACSTSSKKKVLWEKKLFAEPDIAPFVDEAKRYLVNCFDAIEREFSMHEKVMGELIQLGSSLNRVRYERACAKFKVDPLEDFACHSFHVEYGKYEFPKHASQKVVSMHLAKLRLKGIHSEEALLKKKA